MTNDIPGIAHDMTAHKKVWSNVTQPMIKGLA